MKRFFLYGIIFTLSIFYTCTGIAFSESISDRIQLNGFLSQGYVYSTHNDFIPQSSKYGSYEMNEFAMTVSADVSKKLRLGFQLLSRDFGRIGNHQIILDWGFADYKFSNSFGLRLGKIKTPFGFYNEVRDTDALFPMVVLPQSIYDESMRSVFVAYNGLGAIGNLNIGLGSLSYHLFMGGVNHPSDSPYVSQVHTAVNIGVMEKGWSVAPITMDTQLFYGGRAIWKTPLPGLRLGGSFVHLRTKFTTMLSVPQQEDQQAFGYMKIDRGFFLSGEWAIGNFTLSSEYMELPVEISLMHSGKENVYSDETMQGWYVLGTWLFGDKVTLYSYYDRFYAQKGDKKGLSSIRLGMPAYFAWQKDITGGVRIDINFNWTVKFEFHSIDGLSKSYVFNDDIFGTKRRWQIIAAKLSYNF